MSDIISIKVRKPNTLTEIGLLWLYVILGAIFGSVCLALCLTGLAGCLAAFVLYTAYHLVRAVLEAVGDFFRWLLSPGFDIGS